MVAQAIPTLEAPQSNSPLSRLRLVAQRRQADTPEKRQIRAKQDEALFTAQEALHRSADGEFVSALSKQRDKDRIRFLGSDIMGEWTTVGLRAASVWKASQDLPEPERAKFLIYAVEGGEVPEVAEDLATRMILDFLGMNEGRSPTVHRNNHAVHDTITGVSHSQAYIGRGDDGEPQYGAKPGNVTYGLLAPGEEEESYTLDMKDAAIDRREDVLASLYRTQATSEDSDFESFCLRVMCRALLRGYRSKQRFAALLQQHTQYPAPDLTTAVYGMKCMDGDSQELTYMESLSRWLPELIPVATDLLTTYDDLRRVEIAATGEKVSGMAGYPRRGELIGVLSRRIVNAFGTVSNVKAVAKAFYKDEKTIASFLKDRGMTADRVWDRKRRDY